MKRLLVIVLLVLTMAVGLQAQMRPRVVRIPRLRQMPRLARQNPQVPPVLRKALAVARQLRYSGTRWVEFRFGANRNRHLEYVLKDGPRSRVEFPPNSTYAGQVIVEDGEQRFHYFPGRDEVQRMPARNEDTVTRFAQLLRDLRQARLSVGPGQLVAGIPTRLVVVSDAAGNAVQRLWIDPSTGMVLKRELYDAVGTTVGSYEFTSINYNPHTDPSDFQIRRRGAANVGVRERLKRLSKQVGLLPYGLPADGTFQLIAVRIVNPNSPSPVLVQTYRGDRGDISLFQTRQQINPDRLARLAGGKLRSYAWRAGSSWFALLGDVDAAMLVRLAAQVGNR